MTAYVTFKVFVGRQEEGGATGRFYMSFRALAAARTVTVTQRGGNVWHNVGTKNKKASYVHMEKLNPPVCQ